MTQPDGSFHCPLFVAPRGDGVTLAHGEGGRFTRQFIREQILSVFTGSALQSLGDAARLPRVDGSLAMTTDSFVVSPLFFPGGDIGSMSVYGTVNDLAVSGAQPLYLTMSLIIEAGFSLSQLHAILQSAAGAAQRCGVEIVAGDTKVVPAGAADGLFINTTGVGRLLEPALVGPSGLSIGDELIVTGPIGRHGIAVLCAREELALTPPPTSDSGSLVEATLLLRTQLGERLRAMRDATRGGVAAVLHEWAESSHQTLTIAAADVPVTAAVRGACELLGLDPLHIANEGTMVVAVAEGCSREALAILQGLPETSAAACIGRVTPRGLAPVTVTRTLGPAQPLDDPFGAPLPRIC